MKTTLVGLMSGGSSFGKTITSKTIKDAKKKAKEFMENNTIPGTSSKGALWSAGKIIYRITVKGDTLSKRVLAKRRIMY